MNVLKDKLARNIDKDKDACDGNDDGDHLKWLQYFWLVLLMVGLSDRIRGAGW